MKPAQPTFAVTLHEAHSELFASLLELDEVFRSGFGGRVTELGKCLEQVRAHLLEHFRFEEQGGYMAPVLTEEPRLAREVQKLLDEHGQLAQELDALIQGTCALAASQEAHRERLGRWVKHLRYHESHENQLVQEAYHSSGATGD